MTFIAMIITGWGTITTVEILHRLHREGDGDGEGEWPRVPGVTQQIPGHILRYIGITAMLEIVQTVTKVRCNIIG